MIYKEQLRDLITVVLKDAGLYSESATELLMLTAAVESRQGTYIKQIRGPARGIFQMEPATEKDIWENYLKYKPKLKQVVSRYLYADGVPAGMDLQANIPYQILMARIHYRRVPAALPDVNDRLAIAAYWKKHYNTHLGKGTVDKALRAYQECCL